MKVLWVTNITFPEAQALLAGKGAHKGSGGWLLGAMDSLLKHPDLEITVASLSKDVVGLTFLKGETVSYYLLPFGKGNFRVNHQYESLWRAVKEAVKPDVVHIHGTEYTHGLAYIEACGVEKVCVSIQGLNGSYPYYHYGLTNLDILSSITPASLIKGGLFKKQRNAKYRSVHCEAVIIRRVNHIIGRTSWDRDRTWSINPYAKYYHGGETLRKEFYDNLRWNYDNCTKHSIFLSQATVPLKGLHQVLKAMPLVLRHYPDTTIRIAGADIARVKGTWLDRMKLSDYGNIIRKLIKTNQLQNSVSFTGLLDAEGMRDEYLRCNVFVCPSSIENSPNSLAEAQVLGVPCLASYAGGIPDMMQGDEKHLYRYEEVEMLAHRIVELFDQQGDIDTNEIREKALHRHNPERNARELIDIYHAIIQD